MFGLFVGLVVVMNYLLTRTQLGRSMFAVGGNREAARRSGINVARIRITAFMACSMLATLGGVFSAARLASSNQQAGSGDMNLNAIAAAVIGGTSLFGGARIGLADAVGDLGHSGDLERADAAEPQFIAALHDYRWGFGGRGHRRFAGPPVLRQPWPRIRQEGSGYG